MLNSFSDLGVGLAEGRRGAGQLKGGQTCKLEASSKPGWMNCSQPSLPPAWRHPTPICSFGTPDHWLQGTNGVTPVPEDIKSRWQQLQPLLPAHAVVLYKHSVNPPNTTSKSLQVFSWEVLYSPLLMLSPPTASQLTATSRTPLIDIRFPSEISLPTKPNPTPPSEGNCGFCDIPQCPECLQDKATLFSMVSLIGDLISCFVPLFGPRLGTPATSYSTKGPHHYEQKPDSPKKKRNNGDFSWRH